MYVATRRGNKTEPKKVPTKGGTSMKDHPVPGTARVGKSRLLVSFDKAGRLRTSVIAPRGAARLEPKPHVEPHPCPTLASKRSMAVNRPNYCYACTAFGDVRQYETRSVGKVVMCTRCGDNARDATFGRREPLDFAFLGGHFEGSRRRH